ncbi:MAG: hypothetical protein IRZ11_08850, partial [Clostridia bacterium]|nr:hypothetical protein [Clostridia bacterium]
MAFTVEDFRDLLRLLEQHSEWKAELRRALLVDDVLELPRLVRETAEIQKRTEARLEALAARLEELAEAGKRTDARLEALTA